jgi:6-phosphogluconolactonase/glucosamine-6-phosphate isomerase/deaminase
MGYAPSMRIEVYESDAEALEAAAALAEAFLKDGPNAQPAVGIAGGRSGRAIMLALSGRDGIPWKRARFCAVDEPLEEPSNRALLREHLLVPRGVPSPAVEEEDRTGAWEAEVRAAAGSELAFDLLVLELGSGGEIGVLDAERLAAADGAASIVQIPGRIGLGPAALRAARRAILVATGAERKHALAAAVRAANGAALPAHLVLPSARVTWCVDRAAAAELLRDAQPAPA